MNTHFRVWLEGMSFAASPLMASAPSFVQIDSVASNTLVSDGKIVVTAQKHEEKLRHYALTGERDLGFASVTNAARWSRTIGLSADLAW